MIARDNPMIGGLTMTVDLAAQPTAAGSYVRAVVDFAASLGVPRHRVLHDAGLAGADLAEDEARIPVHQLIAVFRSAARHTGNAAFALQFGAHVPCQHVSLAASMGQSASTVPDALAQLNRYVRLGIDFPALGSADRFAFVREGDTVAIVDRRPPDAWPELTDTVFARMALGVCRTAGRNVLRALEVTHPAPDEPAEHRRHFGVPVTFAGERNALLVDASFLDTPLTPAPAIVTHILTKEAEARLRAMDARRSCRGRVEQAIRMMLPSGDVRIERVASALAMSRQTLYRRLKGDGTTFETVLDEVRRAVALERLRSGAPTVRELTVAVGFSDPAVFTRAFKRWTGQTPGAVLRGASAAE